MTRINFILIGDAAVGKSSILKQFTKGEFSTMIGSTIGCEFEIKKVKIEDQEVTFFILDTAGAEVYRQVSRQSYYNSEAVLLVYDVTNPQTFFTLTEWLNNLRKSNLQAEVLIVGNKNEDPNRKKVNVSMLEEFAKFQNLEYIETSAKTGENVDEAFFYLAKKVLFSNGIIPERPKGPSCTSSTGQNSERCEKEIPEDADIVKLENTIAIVPETSGCAC